MPRPRTPRTEALAAAGSHLPTFQCVSSTIWNNLTGVTLDVPSRGILQSTKRVFLKSEPTSHKNYCWSSDDVRDTAQVTAS